MAEIGIGVGDVAWKGDIGPDAERLGKCFQAFFAGAVSEDDELGGMLLAQQRTGLEQCRKVFLRLHLSAAEHDGKAIRLEPRLRRRSVGQRPYLREVDGVEDGGSSEQRRVGEECVSTCSSRWSTDH